MDAEEPADAVRRLTADADGVVVRWRTVAAPPNDRASRRAHRDLLHRVGRELADDCLHELRATGPVSGFAGEAPEWPAGFVGSISHATTLVVATAAARADQDALGIDVELAQPLPGNLRAALLLVEELASHSGADDEIVDRAIASAKEAAFKAAGGAPAHMWASAVTVTSRSAGGGALSIVTPDGVRLAGRWDGWAGHIVTLVHSSRAQ